MFNLFQCFLFFVINHFFQIDIYIYIFHVFRFFKCFSVFFSWTILILNVCCGGPLMCPTVVWRIFYFMFFSFFSWATLILNNMFVVVVLYCVQLLSEEHFISFFSYFSWAILILNNMFVVVVLYCVLFFGSKKTTKSFSPFLFLSFANTFLFFTFLAPFFWNSQNVLFHKIYQNIGCLIKTQ